MQDPVSDVRVPKSASPPDIQSLYIEKDWHTTVKGPVGYGQCPPWQSTSPLKYAFLFAEDYSILKVYDL